MADTAQEIEDKLKSRNVTSVEVNEKRRQGGTYCTVHIHLAGGGHVSFDVDSVDLEMQPVFSKEA